MSEYSVHHEYHISHLPNKRDERCPIENSIKFTVRPFLCLRMGRNGKIDPFMVGIDIYTFSLITTKIVSSGR